MCVWQLMGLKFKNKPLRSCTVSTGGGMLGGHSEIKVFRDGDGDGTLRISRAETHADPVQTSEYPVPAEVFDKLSEMAYQYALYGASTRRMSKIELLDGDTTSVSFCYDNGDFRVRQLQRMTRRMSKGYCAVLNYMNSLSKGN